MLYLSVKFDDFHLDGFQELHMTVTLTLGVATLILYATHFVIIPHLSVNVHLICFSSF